MNPRAHTAVEQHLPCESRATFRAFARMLLLGYAVVVNGVVWQRLCIRPWMLINAWWLASSCPRRGRPWGWRPHNSCRCRYGGGLNTGARLFSSCSSSWFFDQPTFFRCPQGRLIGRRTRPKRGPIQGLVVHRSLHQPHRIPFFGPRCKPFFSFFGVLHHSGSSAHPWF